MIRCFPKQKSQAIKNTQRFIAPQAPNTVFIFGLGSNDTRCILCILNFGFWMLREGCWGEAALRTWVLSFAQNHKTKNTKNTQWQAASKNKAKNNKHNNTQCSAHSVPRNAVYCKACLFGLESSGTLHILGVCWVVRFGRGEGGRERPTASTRPPPSSLL